MKTYKQIISEVAEPLGGDEKRFKAKHVIQKINHPAAEDGQFTGGPSVKKDKSKKASYKEGEDEAVYEEADKEDDMCPECGESYDECECDGEEMEEAKMSDADMKQRENIVKGMKKSKADLQARYGDKWKSVMYATATKKAMEAVELDEAVNVKAIQKAVDDGKSMDVIMTMFANKKTTNTDEIRKIVKDHMWKKRMKKEAVELDEARSLAKKDGYEFFNNDKDESVEVKYKNKIISTGDFDRGANGWFLNIKGQRGQKFFRKPVDVVNFFSKNNIKEAVELDEISQETLRNYHGKAGADLRAKRDKLEKGTLTMKDVKQGQNRVKGLNRAANKMESVELDEAKMNGNYARVMYDYRESYYNITVYKNGKEVAKDDGYFGANETGNPLIKKFTDLVKKAGLKPEGLAIVDEDGKKGVFKGKFMWNTKEAVELDEAFKAGEMKLSDGSSVKLTNEDVSALNTLFKELNSANQKKMQERMMKDKKGFAEIVSFAKEAL